MDSTMTDGNLKAIAAWFGKHRSKLAWGAGLIAILVLGIWIWDPPSVLTTPPSGRIFVGGPEIYTRERLVNDRSEQEEWLRLQLGNVDKETYAPQGSRSRSQRKQLTVTASVGGASAPTD